MKHSTTPSFVSFETLAPCICMFLLCFSQEDLFLCVSGDRVFTHTGMELGKPDPMIKDLII